MATPRFMTPLTKVLESLEQKGYGTELVLDKEGAQLDASGRYYRPEELTIVKVYRFEGESDPADMSVIYAIQSHDGKTGYIMNAYGTYSDQDNPYYDDFIREVKVEEVEEL